MNSTEWATETAETEFVERLARLIEEDGGSRIGGRILGLMLLSPGEMPLDEIAERLRVSKASVSTNARQLENFGVLERRSHPGDRRDFYQVAPDALMRVLERRLAWSRRLDEVVRAGARTEAAGEPLVARRFDTLCRLHRQMVRKAERLLRAIQREAA